jgi:hypothetical protein
MDETRCGECGNDRLAAHSRGCSRSGVAPTVEAETAPTRHANCPTGGCGKGPDVGERCGMCGHVGVALAPASRGDAQPTPDLAAMLHELRAATVRHAQEFTYQEPGWVERNNAAAAEVRAIEARILASQSSPRAHAATPEATT